MLFGFVADYRRNEGLVDVWVGLQPSANSSRIQRFQSGLDDAR